MPKYNTEDIRNLALAGHRASGKTSLADALLFTAKAVDRKGSVLEGQPKNLIAAGAAIDTKTGRVLAYYGGADGTGRHAAAGRDAGSDLPAGSDHL